MTRPLDLDPTLPRPADACDACNGQGTVPEALHRAGRVTWRWTHCLACGGTGRTLREMSATDADTGEG